jgi:hypothetical protein
MEKEIKLLLTLLFVYFFFTQWYGWNEQSHLSLTQAIIEEQRFEIDSYANQTGDRAYYNGHYYSDKNPGLAFLATPTYSSWRLLYSFFPESFKQSYSGSERFVREILDSTSVVTYINPGFFTFTSAILLTFFTSSIFIALTAFLVYKISGFFTEEKKYRLLLALAYGIGTIAFINALHFMSHASETFFSFLSFYLLFKAKQTKSNKAFFLAGIFSGFGFVIDQLNFLIGLGLLIYAFTIDRKNSSLFLLALITGSSPLLLYNFLNFGHPLEFALTHIDRAIFRTAYPEHASLKVMRSSFFDLSLLEKFHVESYNPYVMLRLLFYPYRGLFIYSPILFLSVFGMICMWKKYRTELLLILYILFSFIFFVSMRNNWWGGYFFGPRYLLPVVPFLIFPIALLFDRFKSKLFLVVFFLVLILSVFINLLGLQPAEEDIYDWAWMMMKGEYSAKLNSFQILLNPLVEHYWPLFIKYGPRSWVFENLVNGEISVDIRVYPISKGPNFPFSKFYVPFLCLVPVLCVSFFIWNKEVISVVRRSIKWIRRKSLFLLS